MGIILAALLLAFVVFCNSIELSSQSSGSPQAPNTPLRNEPTFIRVYRRQIRPRDSWFPRFPWPTFIAPSRPRGQVRSPSPPASPAQSEYLNPPSQGSKNNVHNSIVRSPERRPSPVIHPPASPGRSSTGSNTVSDSESSDYLDIQV